MIRILVADDIAPEGLALLTGQTDVTVDVRTKHTPTELAAMLAEYDGVLIRSASKLTAAVLAKPGRLRAVARAGVGVDNVDLEAATAAGILVMNTPDANTVSAAEHTIALMMATARDLYRAGAALKAGKWDRKSFVGRELSGKTLGVIGLGRIGRAVAERAAGLKMQVIGYDRFFSGKAPGYIRRIADRLDEVLRESDVVTVHVPGGGETRGLIGAAELALCKPGVVILNVARGGVIDETALAEAIRSGRVAAAGLDVFVEEPPTDRTLIDLPQVIGTPHLGASTVEAQTAVSTQAAAALLAYLRHGEVRGAVNLTGGGFDLPSELRPYGDLADRMGRLISPLCSGGVREFRLTYRGLLAGQPTGPLTGLLAAAVLQPYFSTALNLVNISATLKSRGIAISETDADAGDAVLTAMEAAIVINEGPTLSISGSVFRDGRGRILSVNGHPMEMKPAGHMVLIFNRDRPGVIGAVGTLMGRHGVNIAEMTISRVEDTALMVLKIDSPASAEAMSELATAPGVLMARQVSLPSIA